MYVCVFVVLRLSCSVDRHVSGCQYLTGVMYVYYAESAKSCSHDSVAAVGDAASPLTYSFMLPLIIIIIRQIYIALRHYRRD